MFGALLGAGAAADIGGGIYGYMQNQNIRSDLQSSLQDIINQINQNYQVPTYDRTPLTPQQYQLLNTYDPQIASFVQTQMPDMLAQVATPAKQAQYDALAQYKNLAANGTSPALQAANEEAQMQTEGAQRGNTNQLMQELGNRGLSGSGQELLSGLTNAGNLSNQARNNFLENTRNQQSVQQNALSGLAGLSTNMANQDYSTQMYNNQLQNQYLQNMVNRQQAYNNYVSGTQNQAQQYNQQMAQNIGNMNTGQNNQYAMYNQQNQNQLANSLAGYNNQKLGMMTGMEQNRAMQDAQMRQQGVGQLTGMIGQAGNLGVMGAGLGMMGGAGGAGNAFGAGLLGASMANGMRPQTGGGGGGYAPSNYNLGVDYSAPQMPQAPMAYNYNQPMDTGGFNSQPENEEYS